MSSMFNWLHLTDLHFGLAGQQPLWPNVRSAFFKDLADLRERTGPWDAVLFTGDFVQRGSKDEYKRLDEEVLGPLWDELKRLGSGDAVLLAVPGNHDLVRPATDRKPTSAEKFLLKPELFAEVATDFWSDDRGEYRQVVNEAFVNFVDWRNGCRLPQPAMMRDGLLPGDFATTMTTADGRRVGVLGLNTSFLQLAGDNYQGKLAWDLRQFHAACGGDGPSWAAEHDVCLLLTHQGPEWLDEHSRYEVYPEINPAGRFALHLFGHMHENVIRTTSTGGGDKLRQWQGNSLFSQVPWGEPPKLDRRHGYTAGRIEFDDNAATIRHWPRSVARAANGWRFIPDYDSCVLADDGGTQVENVSVHIKRNSTTTNAGVTSTSTDSDKKRLIFVSYARADNESEDVEHKWLDRLMQHLKILERTMDFKVWSDTRVQPGATWKSEIESALGNAVAAVLLVSPAFLASDFITSSELPVLLHRFQKQGTRILPLIIRPCLYARATYRFPDPNFGPEERTLSEFQSVNPLDKPLTALKPHEQDSYFVRVAEEILKIE